jgi:hypothetical protein
MILQTLDKQLQPIKSMLMMKKPIEKFFRKLLLLLLLAAEDQWSPKQ